MTHSGAMARSCPRRGAPVEKQVQQNIPEFDPNKVP